MNTSFSRPLIAVIHAKVFQVYQVCRQALARVPPDTPPNLLVYLVYQAQRRKSQAKRIAPATGFLAPGGLTPKTSASGPACGTFS